MKKRCLFIIVAVMMIVLSLAGCAAAPSSETGKTPAKDTTANESSAPGADSISITGLPNGDLKFSMDQVKQFKAFSGRVEGADSEGKPVNYDVKGAYFSDILEKNGYKQAELNGMRIVATDGYSIAVSGDILKTRDIILGYEMDGKALDKDNAPMRIFIPNERAMYWVRMVSELQVISNVASGEVGGFYLLDTLYSAVDYEDYELIGQTYKTLNTEKIISAKEGSGGDTVIMIGVDGLTKNETLANFYKGAINMTGENSPEFFSSVLPSGMYVKNLMLYKYGGSAFVFTAKALEKDKALTLQSLLKLSGVKQSQEYTLGFKDGADMTIKDADAAAYKIGYDSTKGVCIYQSESDKKWNLKSVIAKK